MDLVARRAIEKSIIIAWPERAFGGIRMRVSRLTKDQPND